MSELSRSLVDAAAEALRRARFVDPDDDTLPTFFPDADVMSASPRMDVWRPVECAAEVAVAAVLETLAADEQEHRFGYPLAELRRLAVEARTAEEMT